MTEMSKDLEKELREKAQQKVGVTANTQLKYKSAEDAEKEGYGIRNYVGAVKRIRIVLATPPLDRMMMRNFYAVSGMAAAVINLMHGKIEPEAIRQAESHLLQLIRDQHEKLDAIDENLKALLKENGLGMDAVQPEHRAVIIREVLCTTGIMVSYSGLIARADESMVLASELGFLNLLDGTQRDTMLYRIKDILRDVERAIRTFHRGFTAQLKEGAAKGEGDTKSGDPEQTEAPNAEPAKKTTAKKAPAKKSAAAQVEKKTDDKPKKAATG